MNFQNITEAKYENWNIITPYQIGGDRGIHLFDMIDKKEYQLISTLKENHRSKVLHITIDGEEMVYKIPIEKNNRRWIRFMTLFRNGEAKKNILVMEKLNMLGIKSSIPIMAAEFKKYGMITNSWLLYSYVDGDSCLDQEHTYKDVIHTLEKIHKNQLTHGDPQIRNFISTKDGIAVIDANPKKLGWTGFDRAYEWVYLRKSAPGIERYFGPIINSFWYKYAFYYDLFDQRFSKFRKKIKKAAGLSR